MEFYKYLVDYSLGSKLIDSPKCKICEECDFDVLTLNEAKDGKYIVLACPSAVENIGIKPDKVIKVEDSKVIVNGEKIELSSELSKKIVVRKI